MTRPFSLSRVPSLGRVAVPENTQVQLTKDEDTICTLLDECTKWMVQSRGQSNATSCRIAGGWVRDKLLGLPCNDIDISLENMMGMTFAKQFIDFCSSVKGIPVDKLAKIESNPDRSKHLETARTTVLGIELDFVNLRSEEYSDDSRIPTEVTFGTPLQDALRRDITINTLFYNVHSRQVEDFTEKGISDLRNGVVRTPLPPRETFMDDPLRVIRCVRFASRFGFDLDANLRQSAQDPQIQEAIKVKISRERVGEELDKMLKGRDPLRSIRIINELSLYDAIFYIPHSIAPNFSAPLAPVHNSVVASTLLHIFSQPQSIANFGLPDVHPLLTSSLSDGIVRARLFLACYLIPFLNVTYQDAKQKTHQAVEAAIREGVKLGTQNHYLDGIPVLFSATQLLRNPQVASESGSLKERAAIGMLLRDKSVHNPNTGSHWTTSLLFSLIAELVHVYDVAKDELDVERCVERIHAYNAFVSRVEEFSLPSTVEARTLLDGREVVQILGASKPGPWTGQVLSRVMEWQLEHPHGTKEECEAWLREAHSSGQIDITATPSSRPAQSKRGKHTTAEPRKKLKVDASATQN
ncbi:hypothetical protein K474DRAFT_1660286 [Panus rudis PR-1116 ss-1]|nr:hypothetical protein K474DRAFT_1660286 [Panus rudis PR-1116 ss-1]